MNTNTNTNKTPIRIGSFLIYGARDEAHARAVLEARQADAHGKVRKSARYTHDAIDGNVMWSGSDLAGKARRYGGSYARARDLATTLLDGAQDRFLNDSRRWERAVAITLTQEEGGK